MAEKFGCGWWMVTFPGFESNDCTWRVDGNWHIDGYIHRHYPYSNEIGLIPIIFFSDVLPDGGGTAVAEGSHLVASKILVEAGYKGMSSKELANAVINTNIPFNIIELTGKAGDVIFIHPLLLHARSTNLAPVDQANIRIMCHPSIPLQSHLNYDKSFAALSILEKSIVCGAMNIFTSYTLTQRDIDIILNIHNTFINKHNQTTDTNTITTSTTTATSVTTAISDNNTMTELSNNDMLATQLPHIHEFIHNTLRILKNINVDTCLKFQEKKLKRKRKGESYRNDDDQDTVSDED